LAGTLDIEVLAEGVKTKSHVGFLADAGCWQAQGYHFALPMTAANATDLLGRGYVAGSRTAPVAIAMSPEPVGALAA
jgi:EAL domain-containing protein (putative c-di-GMP-specific phosphodiesterase class I)